jgi:nucleoside-diphosphate-sugar epimerase
MRVSVANALHGDDQPLRGGREPVTTVLVTGSTGFIGRALVARLVADQRFVVRAAVRRDSTELPPLVTRVITRDSATAIWTRADFIGVDAVVHLAGRAQVLRQSTENSLLELRRVNVVATEQLAREAAAGGVTRFVFLSSVKVHGDVGRYTEMDRPAPQEPYAVSKHEAELALTRVASEMGMQWVIIRPPLVYGPGARSNFLALMQAVARGYPLPLGAVHNRRSLIALDNLVDFIVTCIVQPAAANEVFLVSDDEDLSTTELVRRLASAMGVRARLIPVPPALLRAGARLLRRRDLASRLLGSLQVDSSKARRLLGWVPPVRVDEALARAAASWRHSRSYA